MDTQLKIDSLLDESRGICTLKLTGPLVLNNMFEFQSQIRKASSHNVIVDLSDVPYVDSAGIGVLVNGMVSCKNHDRTLVLAGVVERVMTVLKVTKVDQLFQFASTSEAAQQVTPKA